MNKIPQELREFETLDKYILRKLEKENIFITYEGLKEYPSIAQSVRVIVCRHTPPANELINCTKLKRIEGSCNTIARTVNYSAVRALLRLPKIQQISINDFSPASFEPLREHLSALIAECNEKDNFQILCTGGSLFRNEIENAIGQRKKTLTTFHTLLLNLSSFDHGWDTIITSLPYPSSIRVLGYTHQDSCSFNIPSNLWHHFHDTFPQLLYLHIENFPTKGAPWGNYSFPQLIALSLVNSALFNQQPKTYALSQKIVESFAKSFPNLRFLRITGTFCHNSANQLANLTNLETLEFPGSKDISPENLRTILEGCPALNRLSFEGMKTRITAQHLETLINSNIEYLDLRGVVFNDMYEVVSQIPSLKTLVIDPKVNRNPNNQEPSFKILHKPVGWKIPDNLL